jgi:hypothetical protein
MKQPEDPPENMKISAKVQKLNAITTFGRSYT